MQITIKRNITQEFDCFQIRIKLLSKGLRLGIILLIAGILSIIICQNDFGVTDTSLIMYLVLEMIFFLISIFILKRIYSYNQLYKKSRKSALTEYGHIETYSTLTMDDKYLTYESLKRYYKLSWTSLTTYQLYKGSLVIMIDSYLNAFIVKPDELSSTEFNELFLFVSKNLKLRKK